jgi:hypothetical protein
MIIYYHYYYYYYNRESNANAQTSRSIPPFFEYLYIAFIVSVWTMTKSHAWLAATRFACWRHYRRATPLAPPVPAHWPNVLAFASPLDRRTGPNAPLSEPAYSQRGKRRSGYCSLLYELIKSKQHRILPTNKEQQHEKDVTANNHRCSRIASAQPGRPSRDELNRQV